MQKLLEDATKLRVLKLSAFAIASVVAVEVTLGLVVNSLAIVSDGLHALLDLITTITLFIATKEALKPPDEEHLYGHEKFETIGGLVGGIVLIGVALIIFYEAGVKLMQNVGINRNLGAVGFGAIGFTFIVDLYRMTIFRRAGGESSTVKVGFYHALADLSSTLIAFLGFGLAALAGIFWGDAIASIALGFFLGLLSIRLIRSNVMELSDAASEEMVHKIKKTILSEEGVVKSESLRTRKVGSKTFIETSVQVPDNMSLDEAHALASRIESKLTDTFGTVEATIHIEPSQRETGMKQLVKKLAAVDGVREVHEISAVYAAGKLYITLHALVDSNLSVEEAHQIAENIEARVHGEVKQLEHVAVHVEPYGLQAEGSEINEAELRRTVSMVTKGVAHDFRVEKVLTYMANEKRYIDLDCCFTKQITIAEAHDIASKIEKGIKERFVDAVVTVHIEPICK